MRLNDLPKSPFLYNGTRNLWSAGVLFYTDGHRKRLHNLNRLVGWIEGNGGKNLQCHSSEGARRTYMIIDELE